MRKIFPLTISLLLAAHFLFAQVYSTGELDQNYLNWYNRDKTHDDVHGTSVDKTYRELLLNKQPKKTIIVAVIDSGIDIYHDDLKEKIWVNEDEIPNNSIDDDKNGYVDDIHGWNFIGNEKGENIRYENLEYTRIYKSSSSYPDYEKAKELYEVEISKKRKEKENILKFEDAYYSAKNTIKELTGIEISSITDLNKISSGDDRVLRARDFLTSRYKQGFTEKGLLNLKTYNNEYLDYFLNIDFNPRTIVGDDPEDINDNQYGNPDVVGPRADHGTSVAGVIAAVRDNGIGINGIVSHVKIMCLRSTPRGDERDKDVALAIRYAVDNGASIINMSFGKQFSPQKIFVDEAVKYAEQKNVLLVHGSGNDGKNIDETPSYPSDSFIDGKEATNWITVGASGMEDDEKLAAIFSNYGEKHVDVFAPGVNVVSLDSSNTYNVHDGTSLAAPVVSGIAALILSYYPHLDTPALIQILLNSSYKPDKQKVLIPDLFNSKRKKVKFTSLCKSGGIINAYNAMKIAETWKKPVY